MPGQHELELRAVAAVLLDLFGPHVGAGGEAERHDAAARAFLEQPEVAIVGVQDRGAVSRQLVQQLGFRFGRAIHGLEELEMIGADVRDEPQCGPSDLAQARGLAHVVDAHLDDGRFVPDVQPEQRIRDADPVVQIALGLQRAPTRGEHARDHLFRGGLAVAAGDGDKRQREARAMRGREQLIRAQRIGHAEQQRAGGSERRRRRVVRAHDDGGCARGHGRGHEFVGVEPLPGQGHEQVALLHGAGVGVHAQKAHPGEPGAPRQHGSADDCRHFRAREHRHDP